MYVCVSVHVYTKMHKGLVLNAHFRLVLWQVSWTWALNALHVYPRSVPNWMGGVLPEGLLPLKIRLWEPKSWQISAEALQELTHFCIPSARSNSVTLEAREKVVCSDITTALGSLQAKYVGFNCPKMTCAPQGFWKMSVLPILQWWPGRAWSASDLGPGSPYGPIKTRPSFAAITHVRTSSPFYRLVHKRI